MRARSHLLRLAGFMVLAAGLFGCGDKAGTFVRLRFTGTVSQTAPIKTIIVDLAMAGQTSTATFTSADKIVLPNDASLTIHQGEGLLQATAKALAADGTILGTGAGQQSVTRDKTVDLAIVFAPGSGGIDAGVGDDGGEGDGGRFDAGADGAGSDGIHTDAGPQDGPADGATVPSDALVSGDGLAADGVQILDLAPSDAGIPRIDTSVVTLDTALLETARPDVLSAADATVKQDTVLPPSPDARLDTALPVDTTLPSPDASTVVPVLISITPSSGIAGKAYTLQIEGTGFETTSKVTIDGKAVTTTMGGGSLSGSWGGSAQAGAHAVWVENGPNRTSNVLYFDVVVPAGAPEILDYNPDNGVPGDTITLIGKNISEGAITIVGSGGVSATPGTAGVSSWLQNTVETVQFVLANGWQTGAIVVTNSVGSSQGKIFNVGRNLSTLTDVVVGASSEYSDSWVKARGSDNDLGTSWFSAIDDCVSSPGCSSVPWFSVTFPSAQTVNRVAIRGNREYASGYAFIRARIDLIGARGTLWSNSYDLPSPSRDLDITLASPLTGVTVVKFTSLQDESLEPGLSELEVF